MARKARNALKNFRAAATRIKIVGSYTNLHDQETER